MKTVRTVFVILLIILFISQTLLAGGKSSFGIRVGIMEATIDAHSPYKPSPPPSSDNVSVNVRTNTIDLDTRKSIMIGLSWTYRFTRAVEFETGLDYLRTGENNEAALAFDYTKDMTYFSQTYSFDYRITEEYKLSYLHIPLILRLGLPFKVSPYIEAGPSLGFNLSSKLNKEIYLKTNIHEINKVLKDEIIPGKNEYDLKDQTRSFEFGIVFGLGLNINRKFYIMGRLYHATTTVFDSGDFRNDAFMILSGLNF